MKFSQHGGKPIEQQVTGEAPPHAEPTCPHCEEMTKQRDHYRAERDALKAEVDNAWEAASQWKGRLLDTQTALREAPKPVVWNVLAEPAELLTALKNYNKKWSNWFERTRETK